MKRLLRSSRPLRIRRPLSMPAAKMVAHPDAVALAFDYPADKPADRPAGACAQFGQEFTSPCPATCQWTAACYAAYQEAHR